MATQAILPVSRDDHAYNGAARWAAILPENSPASMTVELTCYATKLLAQSQNLLCVPSLGCRDKNQNTNRSFRDSANNSIGQKCMGGQPSSPRTLHRGPALGGTSFSQYLASPFKTTSNCAACHFIHVRQTHFNS